ncbi:MAG: hypothetical protein ACJAZB_000525 [Psychrosphaera sp.]|jgi:hypothetical protein
MRKSDKKIDNQIRAILTELCEVYFEDVPGFKWLTHVVNYAAFPNSLRVICVFESKQQVAHFLSLDNQVKVNPLSALSVLNKQLNAIGINTKKLDNLIQYDSEDCCLHDNHGHWAERIKARYSFS